MFDWFNLLPVQGILKYTNTKFKKKIFLRKWREKISVFFILILG